MLVLSRKPQQGLWIGDDIHITVLAVERGRVKLGIEAAEEIRIDRDELRSAVHAAG